MIIIADDITGAAEIAGMARCQGLQTSLVCGCNVCCDDSDADIVTVIATDTRSLTEEEAVEETCRIASYISHHTSAISHQPSAIFKKTDSALRGHVVAELFTLMQATGKQRAVYLPANPTKGRIIRGGIYYIDGVPIHETDFRFDPEYPAFTSSMHERFPYAEEKGIIMPDAETENDIRRIVSQYDDGKTLFAGAADLLRNLLPSPSERKGELQTKTTILSSPLDGDVRGLLIVCGSTQSRPLHPGIAVAPMPIELYDGSDDINLWDTSAYTSTDAVALTIPHHHRTGKDVAKHLRKVTANKVRTLIGVHRPDHLVIEGGATAWAILQALEWTHFTVVGQFAPGVVQLLADSGTLVTLKPGSYPWEKEKGKVKSEK